MDDELYDPDCASCERAQQDYAKLEREADDLVVRERERGDLLLTALRTVLGDATHGQNMSWEERARFGRNAIAAAIRKEK